ncbi:MAG: hypothetical protein DRO23_10860, partial [Thermoprotei archaeon]
VWSSSGSITTKTKPNSVYMTNRFLSLDINGFLAASDCNRMHGLPEWAALPFLKCSTPTMAPPRNKYPKKLVQEKKLSDKKKLTLKRICRKFNVSEFHGKQIVQLLEMQGFSLDAN